MKKQELLINIGLVLWIFILEPAAELSKRLIYGCARFAKKYPRTTLCALALFGGVFAMWRSLSAPVYDGTPIATAWSCAGGALLLSVLVYALYRVTTSGPHPLQGTRLVDEK